MAAYEERPYGQCVQESERLTAVLPFNSV